MSTPSLVRCRLLLGLLCASCFLPAPKAQQFRQAAVVPTGSWPQNVQVADVQGNGETDLFNADYPTGGTTMLPDSVLPRAVTGTLTASPEPSTYGQNFTLTLSLAPPATGAPAISGTVTFSVDGAAVGSAPVSGNAATFAVIAPPYVVGSHALTAAYSGDFNYSAATIAGTHTVTGQPSVTTLTNLISPIFYGQIVADLAVASAAPANPTFSGTVTGGNITVYIDGVNVCVLPITGAPTSCPPPTGAGYHVGTHTIVLVYSGNQYFAPSTSPTYTVAVLPDDTQGAITSSLNPSTVGQAVTFTAVFTAPYATPVGPVTFFDARTAIGTAPLNASGVATFITSALAAGTHNVVAGYAATLDFNASSSAPVAQVVKPAGLTGTLTLLGSNVNPSVLGQAVTFTALVTTSPPSGTIPTGAITFSIDGVILAPTPLNVSGSASLTTSTLSLGAHNIVASYSGSATAAASVSPTLVQQVNPVVGTPGSGFQLTVDPSLLRVPIGSSLSVTVTVTPLGNFNQPVALSCAGMVEEGTCTFALDTIPAGGGATRLTVAAAAPHTCGTNTPYFVASGATTWLGILTAGGLMVVVRRRRRLVAGLALTVALCILPALTGCGHCTDLGVRPGTYSFSVSGTSTGSPAITVTQTLQMVAHL